MEGDSRVIRHKIGRPLKKALKHHINGGDNGPMGADSRVIRDKIGRPLKHHINGFLWFSLPFFDCSMVVHVFR